MDRGMGSSSMKDLIENDVSFIIRGDANQLIIPGLKTGGSEMCRRKTLDTNLHIIKVAI
jgi:hypothetical protein